DIALAEGIQLVAADVGDPIAVGLDLDPAHGLAEVARAVVGVWGARGVHGSVPPRYHRPRRAGRPCAGRDRRGTGVAIVNDRVTGPRIFNFQAAIPAFYVL